MESDSCSLQPASPLLTSPPPSPLVTPTRHPMVPASLQGTGSLLSEHSHSPAHPLTRSLPTTGPRASQTMVRPLYNPAATTVPTATQCHPVLTPAPTCAHWSHPPHPQVRLPGSTVSTPPRSTDVETRGHTMPFAASRLYPPGIAPTAPPSAGWSPVPPWSHLVTLIRLIVGFTLPARSSLFRASPCGCAHGVQANTSTPLQ